MSGARRNLARRHAGVRAVGGFRGEVQDRGAETDALFSLCYSRAWAFCSPNPVCCLKASDNGICQ